MRQRIGTIENSFGKEEYVSLSNGRIEFLFDTGANMTVLYADTVPESFFLLKKQLVGDIFGNDTEAKILLSLNPKFMFLRRICLLPKKNQSTKYTGIIGTDFIDNCNWLIDFKNGKIYNHSLPQRKTGDMSIHYEKDKGLYYANFVINGIKCARLLIDTGYDRSDFMLGKSELEQMHNIYLSKKDSLWGVFGMMSPIQVFQESYSKINGKNFMNVTYTESESRKIVGIVFLKRFSFILLNTKEQVIECFY